MLSLVPINFHGHEKKYSVSKKQEKKKKKEDFAKPVSSFFLNDAKTVVSLVFSLAHLTR